MYIPQHQSTKLLQQVTRNDRASDAPGRRRQAQAGFSLVEVAIVMAIILLLAIIAIPRVQAYVVQSKVPKVGEELARFILHTRVNASGGLAPPYQGIATTNLANMLADSSVFTIGGSAGTPTILHGLGSDGEVTVAEADAGESFSLTLSNVNHCCPSHCIDILQGLRQHRLDAGRRWLGGRQRREYFLQCA